MTRGGRERPRTYAFGDTAVAARRLRRVAEVFEDTSRQFLREAVPFPPRLALDLGCGPGYTTHLLAEVTGAARSVGMDSSRQFVDAARKTASERASFVEHDVTAIPLPVAGADVIFARFLLSHLVDPDGTVTAWASQLTPGGILALEEVESIRTGNDVVSRYLDLVADLLSRRGTDLYVGSYLDALKERPGWRQRSSGLRTLDVPIAVAAELFAMNLSVWRSDQFARAEYLDELAVDLQELSASETGDVVVWWLRQVTVERRETSTSSVGNAESWC